MAKRSGFETSNQAAKAIIKELEACTYTRSPYQIFEDWLDIIEAALEMEPKHEESMRASGMMAEDPPEVQKLWEKLRSYYDKNCFDHFAQALGYLKKAASLDYRDVIGEVYMAWGWPNTHMGQYFTPWELCKAMAHMTIDVGELHQRLKDAARQSPLASAALIAGGLLQGAQAEAWLIARVIPYSIEHYKPITIHDPACGSGAMLLAAASLFPSWAIRMGLVQFYGMDIDLTCVKMAKVNVMLHGMNGRGLAHVIAWAESILSQAPEPPINPEPAQLAVAPPEALPAPIEEQQPREEILDHKQYVQNALTF